MYVVSASMATGAAKAAVCQPDAVSSTEFAHASLRPLELQSAAECLPELAPVLRNRTPVMKPARTERNATPRVRAEDLFDTAAFGTVEPKMVTPSLSAAP